MLSSQYWFKSSFESRPRYISLSVYSCLLLSPDTSTIYFLLHYWSPTSTVFSIHPFLSQFLSFLQYDSNFRFVDRLSQNIYTIYSSRYLSLLDTTDVVEWIYCHVLFSTINWECKYAERQLICMLRIQVIAVTLNCLSSPMVWLYSNFMRTHVERNKKTAQEHKFVGVAHLRCWRWCAQRAQFFRVLKVEATRNGGTINWRKWELESA